MITHVMAFYMGNNHEMYIMKHQFQIYFIKILWILELHPFAGIVDSFSNCIHTKTIRNVNRILNGLFSDYQRTYCFIVNILQRKIHRHFLRQ